MNNLLHLNCIFLQQQCFPDCVSRKHRVPCEELKVLSVRNPEVYRPHNSTSLLHRFESTGLSLGLHMPSNNSTTSVLTQRRLSDVQVTDCAGTNGRPAHVMTRLAALICSFLR
jgi:hypothetical protein